MRILNDYNVLDDNSRHLNLSHPGVSASLVWMPQICLLPTRVSSPGNDLYTKSLPVVYKIRAQPLRTRPPRASTLVHRFPLAYETPTHTQFDFTQIHSAIMNLIQLH